MASVADATVPATSAPADAVTDAAAVENQESETGTAEESVAEESVAEASQADAPIQFEGTPRNMVAGIAMLLASVMAFTMGMTDVFFAEATAWTFAIWGGLLIYAGVLDIFRVFEVTEGALVIKDDFRPWGRRKEWDWERLNRVDVLVKKRYAQLKDVEMQIYYNPEGELAQEREDRIFDAELARQIIERAELKPSGGNPEDLTSIPLEEKQTFTWNK